MAKKRIDVFDNVFDICFHIIPKILDIASSEDDVVEGGSEESPSLECQHDHESSHQSAFMASGPRLGGGQIR